VIACLSCNGSTTNEGRGPATVLAAATVRGVYLFERASSNLQWARRGQALADLHISALLFEPRSGLLFAGAHGDGGLWASEDDGRTWSERSTGLARRHVYSLAVQHRGDATVLFAGTEPPAVYRSDDLGLTWRELAPVDDVAGANEWTFPPPPHIAHVKNIASHPSAPQTLYVCIEQGALLRTTDDGRSWFEVLGYASGADLFHNDNHRVLIRPSAPHEIFMCGGEGLYYSADAGIHWEHLTRRRDRVGYPDAMFIDPRDERVLYMAGARFAPRRWGDARGADPTVLRSCDGGRSWEEIRDGLPTPLVGNIEAMALYRYGDQVMLALGTATGQIFACESPGAPWSRVADGLPPISKGGHYRWFMSSDERLRVEDRMRAGR
jgi:photosystem II stability/assembly factor-like uncharacterized protein